MMRAGLVAVCACLLLASAPVAGAQDAPPEAVRVRRAIASGDASAVLSGSANRLEIALFGATKRYSRSQARFVLQKFFREYPRAQVTPLDGTGTPDGWFESMAYAHERGTRPLRIYARYRRTDRGWELHELILREAP